MIIAIKIRERGAFAVEFLAQQNSLEFRNSRLSAGSPLKNKREHEGLEKDLHGGQLSR